MIKKLTTLDHNEFSKIRLQGLESYPVAFATMAVDWKRATPEQSISSLRDSESSSSNFVLGAFEEGELVGLIGFKREGRQSVDHKGSVWGFFVIPEFQRKGIGSALLKRLIVEAREMNLRYLRLVTAVSSISAINLFEKNGFKAYGIEEKSIKDENNFFDQVYMRLDFYKGE